MVLEKFGKKYDDAFYFIFRVFVGFLFFQHGAQKLFGWFTDKGAVELTSLMGVAGVIEVFGGILIAVGLFTRLAALISGLEMLYAYLTVHMPRAVVPISNGGELALLYFAVFLIILTHGARKLSLERALFKKEIF